MNYFVTGATGFIGRFLLECLLAREGAKVYVLVREASADKFEALVERYAELPGKLEAMHGDITTPGLVSQADFRKLAGKVNHVFHLAAAYDMNMDEASAHRVNVEGTRNVVAFVNDLGGKLRLHHMSSIAVAGGDHVGRFTEKMFDVGQTLNHPYYRTKFESEKIVRADCRAPWRVYRPGVVVGDSRSGEIDKIDGPYYFFKAVQKVSYRMPKWLPLLGVEGGRVAIAPVDYVAAAMDALAHQDGLDGECFHLMQAKSPSVGDLLSLFLNVAHGPEFAAKLALPWLSKHVKGITQMIGRQLPQPVLRKMSDTIGVPFAVLGYTFNRALFDDRATRRELKGAGVQCPDIGQYAEKLWQFWELFLDIDTTISPKLIKKLGGKIVLITGASSGIGFNTAKKLALAGAEVVLVARTVEKLEEAKNVIEKLGGKAHIYPCDLTDLVAIDKLSKQILADLGHVDVLINNAGRSIRRAVFESFKRYHDYERTMQLNYFGAVRLIMNLLPSMAKRKSGHIINISSIGVLANAARFSAYVASKAALDAYTRCLSAEVRALNIHTTAIYMPLVRTPMIAPTKAYDYVPTWSPDDAANTVIKAILEQPKSIATPLGTAAAVSYAIWPKFNDYVLSMGYRLFPSTSSSAVRGRRERQKPTLEQVVFANVFKGEHW